MTRERFEDLVGDALASIPARFRDAMENLVIVVDDEPSSGLLRQMGIAPPATLLGLYQGTPLTERSWGFGNQLPDRILIFQGPHERNARSDDAVVGAIAETLIHEVGHYFGMSEDDIQAIEKHYWRAHVGRKHDS